MFELTLAIVVVVVTSATCSLFEAALYSLPQSQIESLVQGGRRSGFLLRKMREQVDAPITAILSLNTIANTAGATIIGALALRALGEASVIYVSVTITALILFLAEVLPKTIGVVYSRSLAPFIALPLHFLVIAFRPIIWLCSLGTRLIARPGDAHGVSPEELTVMAHLAMQTGSIDPDEAEVIKNVLSVKTKTVRDVMTPRPVLFSLPAEISVDEALKDERIYSHSRIPAYGAENETIDGIVFRRDILSAIADDRGATPLESLMRPPRFVSETQSLSKALRDFLKFGEHMFIVMDEFGGLAGVITLEDIIEEILGKEIVDEFDRVTDMRELARQRREALLKSAPEPPKSKRLSIPKRKASKPNIHE